MLHSTGVPYGSWCEFGDGVVGPRGSHMAVSVLARGDQPARFVGGFDNLHVRHANAVSATRACDEKTHVPGAGVPRRPRSVGAGSALGLSVCAPVAPSIRASAAAVAISRFALRLSALRISDFPN